MTCKVLFESNNDREPNEWSSRKPIPRSRPPGGCVLVEDEFARVGEEHTEGEERTEGGEHAKEEGVFPFNRFFPLKVSCA